MGNDSVAKQDCPPPPEQGVEAKESSDRNVLWTKRRIIVLVAIAFLCILAIVVALSIIVFEKNADAPALEDESLVTSTVLLLKGVNRILENSEKTTFETKCAKVLTVKFCHIANQKLPYQRQQSLQVLVHVEHFVGQKAQSFHQHDANLAKELSSEPVFQNLVVEVVSESTLTDLPVLEVPSVPCPQDPACGRIIGALDPVFPLQTKALLNIPGSCQNWAREWLRSGKDIMEFSADRIRQRYTMALLYCEFKGDDWLEGELWVSDLHECDWYTMVGVDPCSPKDKYQIIPNYGHQMRGTLPPELSMISSLWEITLFDNLISGTIPTDYAKLSQLDTLSLSFNLIQEPIPDFVWRFEDMIYLDLAYNFFTGTIPNNVHLTAPNLQVLLLEANDLSGKIPDGFGSMNWKRLSLARNELTGSVPSDINSQGLEELHLHNNMLTGTLPVSSFFNIQGGAFRSKLKEVTINGNQMEGDVDEMCILFYNGSLELFQVDLDKITCECCSGAP